MANTTHSLQLFAGDFPELQAQFLADVAELRAADPLAPLTVLVPGVLAGLSLRRELARAGTSHANVQFFTLTDFAQTLAEPQMAERGLRRLPEVLRAPLMKRAVEMCGSLRYFHRMAARAGFQHAAWATIQELKAAGLNAQDLDYAARRTSLDALVQSKVQDIAAIWRAYDALMLKHRFVDRATPPLAPPLQQGGMMLYGLDELSFVERRFVLQVISDCDVIAYLPFRASDAYIWSEPLYQWYLEQGFEAELLEPDERAAHGDMLARVQEGTFEENIKHQTSNIKSDDHSLLVVSAASRDNEVEEIVREVIYSPHDAPRNTAVLMRESRDYLPLLREECTRSGITGYFHERRRIGETPAGRALRSLTTLLDEKYRRADVTEFLLSSPLRRPSEFPADLPEVPASEWNHFALQAQIIAGEVNWRKNLQRLHNHFTKTLAEREWEMDDPTAPLQRHLRSLAAFQDYIMRLFAQLASVRAANSWKELGDKVTACFAEYVDSADVTEIMRAQFAQIELLDHLGSKPNATEFASYINAILSQPLEREGKFQVHEPTVAKISDALGVVFDDVVLCGVVEKEFPRRAAQDPLLLDDERKQLQYALNNPDITIPLRARLWHRERFLFRVALNSARRRVVLTYPRLDAVEGREWLASAFLLRALEAATGEPADYGSLESFVRTSPQARRVPLNRLHARDATRCVTGFQYDLAQLGRALETKSPDDVAYLFCADQAFKRGVLAERKRYRTKEFTPFDGAIEDSVLRERLRTVVPALSPKRISRYVTCPFQYYLYYLLELTSSPEPQWIQAIDSRARGMIVHEILEQFYRTETQAGRWPLTPDAGERLERTAEKSFADFETNQVPGLPLLWDIEKQSLRQRLNLFVANELNLKSTFRPKYFGVTYGLGDGDSDLSRSEPVTVPLANGLALHLRGTFDRVDVDDKGNARLIDYTTAKYSTQRKRSESTVAGIEPHAARLAAAALGLDVETFTYYLLTKDEAQALDVSRATWEQNRERVATLIDNAVTCITGGQFYPRPSGACDYCTGKAACGTGRFTHKWANDLPQTQALRVLQEGDNE